MRGAVHSCGWGHRVVEGARVGAPCLVCKHLLGRLQSNRAWQSPKPNPGVTLTLNNCVYRTLALTLTLEGLSRPESGQRRRGSFGRSDRRSTEQHGLHCLEPCMGSSNGCSTDQHGPYRLERHVQGCDKGRCHKVRHR